MNPRGRWRRSRNLRRVPTTEEAGVGEGSKISPVRRSLPSQSPLLEVFFLDIAFKIASDRLKKSPPKKKHRQTDSKQTDRSEPISRSAGSRFQTLKTLLPLGEALKRGSRIKLPDSLNIPTNGHLRLPRSLALSSNCACGAISHLPIFYQRCFSAAH